MSEIYTRNICPYKADVPGGKEPNCLPTWDLPEILTNELANGRDYCRLTYIWKEFRENSKAMRPHYEKFVELSNKGARQGIRTGDFPRQDSTLIQGALTTPAHYGVPGTRTTWTRTPLSLI